MSKKEMSQKKTKNKVCLLPVYSPRISLDIMTVKMGAELFTVSANDTATLFRLTSPNTTVVNLTGKQRGKSYSMIYYSRKDIRLHVIITRGHKLLI